MIDTIKGSIRLASLPPFGAGVVEMNEHENYAPRVKNYTLKNIRIRAIENQSQNSYLIKIEGSLTKYFHGNNISYLSRKDFLSVLDELTTQLGFDISELRLSRIDIGACIELKRAPSYYLKLLKAKKRFKKRITLSATGAIQTIEFFTCSTRVCFYDKKEEIKSRREQLDNIYRDKNILRYEIQYKKNLATKLGHPLTIKDLMNKGVYRRFQDDWVKVYKGISKTRLVLFKRSLIQSNKVLKSALASFGYQKLSQIGNLPELLDNLKTNGEISSKKRSEINSTLNKMSEDMQFTATKKPIKELNKKIIAVSKFSAPSR